MSEISYSETRPPWNLPSVEFKSARYYGQSFMVGFCYCSLHNIVHISNLVLIWAVIGSQALAYPSHNITTIVTDRVRMAKRFFRCPAFSANIPTLVAFSILCMSLEHAQQQKHDGRQRMHSGGRALEKNSVPFWSYKWLEEASEGAIQTQQLGMMLLFDDHPPSLGFSGRRCMSDCDYSRAVQKCILVACTVFRATCHKLG